MAELAERTGKKPEGRKLKNKPTVKRKQNA